MHFVLIVVITTTCAHVLYRKEEEDEKDCNIFIRRYPSHIGCITKRALAVGPADKAITKCYILRHQYREAGQGWLSQEAVMVFFCFFFWGGVTLQLTGETCHM